MSILSLTGMYIYPIKSCKGISIDHGTIGPRGFLYDRHWMVTDPEGRFQTQRELPRMALIVTRLTADSLILTAPGAPELRLPLVASGARKSVVVWRDTCEAIDAGDAAADWFSAVLVAPVRLVHMAQDYVRQVNQTYAPRVSDQVGFADAFPFLIISEESLDDLNSRLDVPLPMNRFRPNLVVRGADRSFAEDTWKRIRIGDIVFDIVKPCARCAITTTDQDTARRGKEPLRTLATFRDVPDRGVMFGQNVVHASPGAIRLTDPVEVLEYRS